MVTPTGVRQASEYWGKALVSRTVTVYRQGAYGAAVPSTDPNFAKAIAGAY